jgi:hypothetical protein
MTRIATERRDRPQGNLISLLIHEGERQTALRPEEVNAFALQPAGQRAQRPRTFAVRGPESLC